MAPLRVAICTLVLVSFCLISAATVDAAKKKRKAAPQKAAVALPGEVLNIAKSQFAKTVYDTSKLVFIKFHPFEDQAGTPQFQQAWRKLARHYELKRNIIIASFDAKNHKEFAKTFFDDDSFPKFMLFRGYGGQEARATRENVPYPKSMRIKWKYKEKDVEDPLELEQDPEDEFQQMKAFVEKWIEKDQKFKPKEDEMREKQLADAAAAAAADAGVAAPKEGGEEKKQDL